MYIPVLRRNELVPRLTRNSYLYDIVDFIIRHDYMYVFHYDY